MPTTLIAATARDPSPSPFPLPTACPPGQVPIGETPEGVRVCAVQPPVTPKEPPAAPCLIAISYPAGSPDSPTISSLSNECTAEGSAIAMAILIARILK